MNDILALAAAVRESYLQALTQSLRVFMAEHSPSSPEVMLEFRRDVPLPFRLYRADMAANVDGEAKIQDVNPTTHLSFEPFEVEVEEGAKVAVHPFVWNDVGIHANAALPTEHVEKWATHWLDPEDQLVQDEQGLRGVIHSICREDHSDGSSLLMVDFGSAPVEAFNELVELALAAGASQVSIHSSTL